MGATTHTSSTHTRTSADTAANLRSQAVIRRIGMTRDPADDFDDLTVPDGPLRPSVVYRMSRGAAA